MDPVSSATSPTASATNASSDAAAAAEFQTAFDNALVAAGVGAISIALEELIQVATSEE